VEMKVVAKGKSAHAASNHLGDNAIYKLLPIIDGIANMQPQLGDHEFLGPGRITVTDMDIQTPSINAVPNEATIFIDRRTTWGETTEGVVEQVKGLIGDRSDMSIGVLMYDKPSYTGFVFPLEKVYPAWLFEEDHPFVQAGLETLKALGRPAESGKWNFSTNGIYWAGKAGIPSIGYGPGQEEHAHTVLDQVSLEDVVQSTAFYALLPSFVRKL
ncbi:MAG: peptidase dimerization domain-containing protein, partial [Chloroflexi bacterium]|nr:peptidase dimerization domain-containing protein [Chloroflexota bacterium]